MKLTRKDFIKKSVVGTLAVVIGSKIALPITQTEAATSNSNGITISDNQTDKGICKSVTPPDNLNKVWLCTQTNGTYYKGVTYYHDGSGWVPTVATWA